MSSITVSNPQELTGWLVFEITSLTVEVHKRKQPGQKDVRFTAEPPENAPIRLAIQQFPGSGTQPENTLTLVAIGDIVQQCVDAIEDAIEKTDQPKGDW